MVKFCINSIDRRCRCIWPGHLDNRWSKLHERTSWNESIFRSYLRTDSHISSRVRCVAFRMSWSRKGSKMHAANGKTLRPNLKRPLYKLHSICAVLHHYLLDLRNDADRWNSGIRVPRESITNDEPRDALLIKVVRKSSCGNASLGPNTNASEVLWRRFVAWLAIERSHSGILLPGNIWRTTETMQRSSVNIDSVRKRMQKYHSCFH